MAAADVSPLDLLGTWTLTREIEDRWGGEARAVRGSATLTRVDEDHVRWGETGTMTWAGHAVPVSRTLDVVRRGEAWWVLFADGRDFHPWSVGEQVHHPCGRDDYRGLVEVSSDRSAWTVRWDCRGPEKNYTMRTRHTARQAPAAPSAT